MNTKYEGIANYSSNFNVNIGRPLDTRQVVNTLDLLTKPKSTFSGFAYNGMVVSIPEEGLFVLNNYNESKVDSTEYDEKSIIGDNILKEYGWNRLLTTEVPGSGNDESNFITLNNLKAVIRAEYQSVLHRYIIQNDTHAPANQSLIGLSNNVLDDEDNTVSYSKMILRNKYVDFFIFNTIDTGNVDYNVFNIKFSHDSANNLDNTLFKITHNPVSLESKVTGSIIVTSESETINDDQLVSVGYLNKKLEEFTPKVQSQLKMYVYDIDENDDTTETTDVANIQIVRETNGTLTFEVEDTSTPEAEVLSGNSNTTINKTLQLNINDKKSDGTITPTTEVASVMVVRNVSGKMSIKINEVMKMDIFNVLTLIVISFLFKADFKISSAFLSLPK